MISGMRVMHVIAMLELGGSQQNTLHTCTRLAERGHDVILCHGPGGLLEARARLGPFRTIRLPHLLRRIDPLADVRAYRELRAVMRDQVPDVVHTHGSKAGVLGRVAARRAGVPLVVHTVHGWSYSPYHPPLLRMAYRQAERLARRHTDHLISVSRLDIDYGLEEALVPASWSIIRSGIDIAYFATSTSGREDFRSRWGVREDDVLVVNPSCLKPQKAPLDFVRAAARASRDESRLRFLIAGDGVLRREVEDLTRSLGLEGKLCVAGWQDDMRSVFQAADIVSLTSHWEGLPRSLVQARAARRPVVATRVNGVPEVIVDGVNGYLVEPMDVSGLAAAYVALARDPALRRRLGGDGAGLEEFDQDLMVDEQERLYNRLLAAVHARSEIPRHVAAARGTSPRDVRGNAGQDR
jgi:glycosyltransferase involved in cell wall biosynthesis